MSNEVTQKPQRIISLDVFRGITIIGMILVNNPGSWGSIYPALKHAEWHGCTPTDLIFPFFLFIIGVAMPYSFSKRIEKGDSKNRLLMHVFYRSSVLFILGMILTGFPDYNFYNKLILDVLQRIGVIYLFTGIIFLYFNIRWQVIIAGSCIIIYWLIMMLIPVPGVGAGNLDPDNNFWRYVDIIITSGWHNHGEGILSLIPSISTVLIGVFTGYWLRSKRESFEKVAGMLVIGSIGLALGVILDIWFPLNKLLWSSSYVIYTGGFALVFLSICYYFIDLMNWRKWCLPFLVFGMNAITVFFLSSLLGRILGMIKISITDGYSNYVTVSLKNYIFQNIFKPWNSDLNASLFYAVSYIFCWFIIMLILYRKNIFIKI